MSEPVRLFVSFPEQLVDRPLPGVALGRNPAHDLMQMLERAF